MNFDETKSKIESTFKNIIEVDNEDGMVSVSVLDNYGNEYTLSTEVFENKFDAQVVGMLFIPLTYPTGKDILDISEEIEDNTVISGVNTFYTKCDGIVYDGQYSQVKKTWSKVGKKDAVIFNGVNRPVELDEKVERPIIVAAIIRMEHKNLNYNVESFVDDIHNLMNSDMISIQDYCEGLVAKYNV